MDQFRQWEEQTKKFIGGLFLVPLQGELHSYAQLLADHTFAFYDCLSWVPVNQLDQITSKPVLFRLAVMSLVLRKKKSSWRLVGYAPIPGVLHVPATFCRQSEYLDSETGEIKLQYRLSHNNTLSDPVSQEEGEQYEVNAVWNPSEIQERLRQHYNLNAYTPV